MKDDTNFFEKLKIYLETTPEDEIKRVFDATASWDNTGPSVEDYFNQMPKISYNVSNEFVSVELALLLKDLGFNYSTLACYELHRGNALSYATSDIIAIFGGYTEKLLYTPDNYPTVLAPLYQQVTDWLLAVHNIKIFIDYNIIDDKFYYGYKFVRPNGIHGAHWKHNDNGAYGWDTPKEALIFAIENEIKLLKDKYEQQKYSSKRKNSIRKGHHR